MAAVAYAEATSLALLTTQACAVDWSRQAGDQIPSRVRSLILNPAILSYRASLRCAHQGHKRLREESLLPLLPPDYLNQHPLPPPAVKLAVKDPLPCAEDFGEFGEAVEPAVGHRHHRLAAHDLPLEVGVGVILTRPIVQPASGPAWSIGACGASFSSHTS